MTDARLAAKATSVVIAFKVNRKRLARIGIVLLGPLLAAAPAFAQQPKAGDPMTFALKNQAGSTEIQFRYCPAGQVQLGKPTQKTRQQAADQNNANPLAAIGGPQSVALRSFYLSEAEITIGQFMEVVGEERFRHPRNGTPS